MSALPQLRSRWEGRIVEGKFPLKQQLGNSEHSKVFLTQAAGATSQKAAIKLIPAESGEQQGAREEVQLLRWQQAAGLSHSHLLRLFDFGRCQFDDDRFLYVVMEYAEENLAEILPLRALSHEEALQMLRPTVEALAYLHRAGWVHAHIRPSNILAVDNTLKISADGIGKAGERVTGRSAYDAPEVANSGTSSAADIWSLGATLVTVLTQHEPAPDPQGITLPQTVPHPLREIAEHCLQVDPQLRWTVNDILRRLDQPESRAADRQTTKQANELVRPRWVTGTIAAAALIVIGLLTWRFMGPPASPPASEAHSAVSPKPQPPAAQSPVPFSQKESPAQTPVHGSVQRQVLPEISHSAQHTIQGTIRITASVSVDDSGSVTVAKLTSAGPSRYFAERALEAARGWKFDPPQIDGKASASEWSLHFQLRRSSLQVSPVEIRP